MAFARFCIPILVITAWVTSGCGAGSGPTKASVVPGVVESPSTTASSTTTTMETTSSTAAATTTTTAKPVTTTTRPPTTTTTRVTSTTTRPAVTNSSCDPHYPGVCIPPPPPDLDCAEISHKNFAVVGGDPHGFDADKDGIGCEKN